MKARRIEAPQMNQAPLFPTRCHVVGWQADRGILVELAGGEVALAQTLVALSEAELQTAVAERRVAMLTFEDGDRSHPVILGLLAPVPAQARTAPSPEEPVVEEPVVEEPVVEEPVVIKGRESIELRCGAASITLRKDGKVVLRGTTIISRATEQNRIAGGTVHFN